MNDENLKKVYEQYWLHARHQEIQRLWFANIYALIVAGVFAYFGASGVDDFTKLLLLIFLVILSLFGYLMTYSWNIPFTIYSRLAELIAIKDWDIPGDYQRFTKYKKAVKAGSLFVGFYSLMLGVFVALLVHTICKPTNSVIINYDWHNLLLIVIGIIVFLGFYLFYHLYLDKRGIGKIQEEFEDKVKEYRNKKQLTKTRIGRNL